MTRFVLRKVDGLPRVQRIDPGLIDVMAVVICHVVGAQEEDGVRFDHPASVIGELDS